MSALETIAPPRAVHQVTGAAERAEEKARPGPPMPVWGMALAVQAALAIVLTHYTYFFVDDFIFLDQGRRDSIGLSYLRQPLFEHFSPLSRAVDWAVGNAAPGSFLVAHGIMIALFVCAVAAMGFALTTILGNTWGAFVLTMLFGQSLFLMRLLTWWTATVNMLPATALELVAIAGYLRWRRGGARRWAVISLLAFAGSLVDHETAMLLPLYLALIALLVMEDRVGVGAWLSRLWRERTYWLALGVLELAALANFVTSYYFAEPRPTVRYWLHYMEVASIEAFVPGVLGIRNRDGPFGGHVTVALAAVVVAGACALLLYLRPRAWRCLVAFCVAFAATMGPIGLNRVVLFGLPYAADLQYQQTVALMWFVLLAFAVSRRWGGARRSAVDLRRWSSPSSRRLLASAAAAALTAYAALYAVSAHSFDDNEWPNMSRAFFDNLQAGYDKARARTAPSPPVFLDETAPPGVMPAAFAAEASFDRLFWVVDPNIVFDKPSDIVWHVDWQGIPHPVTLAVQVSLAGGRATFSATDGSGATPALPGADGVCAPGDRAVSRLHLPVPVQSAPAPGRLLAGIRASYTMSAPATVALFVRSPGGGVPVDENDHDWAGTGGDEAVIAAPVGFDEVEVDLPAGSCVQDLSFGLFVPPS